ncbi:hypothetical protein [Herpetosiphon giganteus]|uniref:hypothetical protein n=1 Tax=Herpetosiphon giganteus TaxID=2029754 RepID=UPI00195CCE2D|nr:hypothetical protein [Herpetosiphon giganteus]MBM7841987.1 hypothetical protein [Herpetosiphon giganteus]
MTYWFRVMLWTVLGVIASCFALIGIAMCAINIFFDRDTAENARIAPIIIDESIDECSISPARNFVLATTFKDGVGSQKIYNLKTGDEIAYPDNPEADPYGNNSYGDPLGWINDPTQDIVLVDPYWLVNLTTGEVTKVELSAKQQSTDWWEPMLIPDDYGTYVKSPDQQYVADNGKIYRSARGYPPVGDLIVEFSNIYPEICSNAWEPDSSGYYFADVYGRGRMLGPLRFLKNPER